MKKLLLLVVLAALVAIGWINRERVRALLGAEEASAPYVEPASPELARRAEQKLARLEAGQVDQVVFRSNELQSLLQYKFIQLLPAFVDSPRVKLARGKIEVSGRVPVDRLPSVNELGEAASFLPDTTELELTGSLIPLDSGRVALSIDEVSAARIPLPRRLVPSALARLGRKPEAGLPRNALALPLPGGAGSALVQDDSLILKRRSR